MNAPLAKQQIELLMSSSLIFREPTIQGTEGTVAAPRPATLGRWVKDALARLADLPRRRAVIDELSTLTDRELADIGLNRNELKRVFEPDFAQTHRHR